VSLTPSGDRCTACTIVPRSIETPGFLVELCPRHILGERLLRLLGECLEELDRPALDLHDVRAALRNLGPP
jgi:hypothetical protein